MKHTATLLAVTALVLSAASASRAQNAPAGKPSQTIHRAGSQPSSKGPAENFTGNVTVAPLFPANASAPYSGAYVTFEAGARSASHTHPTGQRLVVTAEVGRTAEWGGRVQEIKAGDVVWCPPGVKHWHGASPTTAMTHIALTGAVNNKAVEWMEKVTDAQYNAGARTMNTSHALSAKQRSIILIAAFTAAGDQERLRTALTEGLEAGLTVNEIKEILVQMYAYAAVEGYDYMALRGPAGVLHDLIVDPGHRGRGVGRLLLGAALKFLRSRRVPRVVLSTAERNEAAQRLFASAGFRPTMIEMTRELDDPAS